MQILDSVINMYNLRAFVLLCFAKCRRKVKLTCGFELRRGIGIAVFKSSLRVGTRRIRWSLQGDSAGCLRDLTTPKPRLRVTDNQIASLSLVFSQGVALPDTLGLLSSLLP